GLAEGLHTGLDELVPGAALGELAQGHHDLAPGHLRQVRLKGLRSGSSSPGRADWSRVAEREREGEREREREGERERGRREREPEREMRERGGEEKRERGREREGGR